jgi:hypothetical protein
MPYLWKGVCYQDTASALQGFLRESSTFDSSGVVVVSSATINNSGLITWTGRGLQISGSAWGPSTYTTQLGTCTAPTMNQWPVQSFLLIFALFFAAMFGFRTGYRP